MWPIGDSLTNPLDEYLKTQKILSLYFSISFQFALTSIFNSGFNLQLFSIINYMTILSVINLPFQYIFRQIIFVNHIFFLFSKRSHLM